MKIVTITDMSVDEAREYKGHLVCIMRHKPTGKHYITHSGNFSARYSSMPHDKWMNGYSISDFEFKFVECDISEAKEITDHFIDTYKSITEGLNKGYAQEPSDRLKSGMPLEKKKVEDPVNDAVKAKWITHDGVRGIFLAIE